MGVMISMTTFQHLIVTASLKIKINVCSNLDLVLTMFGMSNSA